MSWQQQPVPERVREAITGRVGTPAVRFYVHTTDGSEALLSRDSIDEEDERWHISVAGRGRVATWDELVEAAHEIRPGVVFVVGVPPRSWWMNVHPNVLHLWELKDENLAEQWLFERMGMKPT